MGMNDGTGHAMRIRAVQHTEGSNAVMIFNSGVKDGTGGANLATGNVAFQFRKHDDTELVSIMGDGKVGIGVTAPDGKLQINDAGASSNGLVLRHSTNDTTQGFNVLFKATNVVGAVVDYGKIKSEIQTRGNGTHDGTLRFYNASGGTLYERLTILGDSGNVGVGVTDPDEKLECNGAFHVSGPRVAGAQPGLYLSSENSAGQANIIANGADASTVGTMLFIVRESDAGGAVTAMSVATTGVISGDFNDTSDEALKTNIKAIPAGLSIVNALNPVTFDWDSDVTRRSGSNSGFIAQEVETVLPNDVSGDDYDADDAASGKSINVTGIVAHLTKAVQELSDKVTALENA